MGLTNSSVGIRAVDSGLVIKKQAIDDKVVAIAGNPNVGKSTVFNGLTGMKQHTGNWPGKTVANAQGYYKNDKNSYVLVDIPGTYSLMAHSEEEEVARNFICFGNPQAVIVVCDATLIERNLNLVLQTIEISDNVIVALNLMDEAKRKNIKINTKLLSDRLGVPVIGTTARKKKSLEALMRMVDKSFDNKESTPYKVIYPDIIENAINMIEPVIKEKICDKLNSRWVSLKLIDPDNSLINEIKNCLGNDFLEDEEIKNSVEKAKKYLYDQGIRGDRLKDMIVSAIIVSAEKICDGVVTYPKEKYNATDRKVDKLLTSKWFGYPLMVLLLLVIFWITITGANYPSDLIALGLGKVQVLLENAFDYLGVPLLIKGIIIDGIYKVLAWVVSVMLPPMAIFFPLFTLLEDIGYLPRVAYNLDKPFKKCCACGKQALTMCMGFGCNAAGIIGCRIIDSPRERLLAILTNNFVPCNGRFPTLIAVITMFFVGVANGFFSSILSALILTAVIILGILLTFLSTKILSKTILKGTPSSFTLEMPPYRKPQIGKVIVRSIMDRTLFVLGRAVLVAAPAGLIIWIMANITVDSTSLLNICANFLDPFAKLMGLDGIILIAFILGFPANEIVVPIIIMAYLAKGSILDLGSLEEMRTLFVDNGWTWITAISMMLFSLMHWPCSTTVLTIKKETGSLKWAGISMLIPTVFGIVLCMVFTFFARMI